MRSRYLEIEDRTQDLADLLREAPEAASEFLSKYELSWIYHENALEGVVYSSQELQQALGGEHLAEASSISALRDAKNFKAAIEVARAAAAEKKLEIDLALVKKLYETLHAGIESRANADFRRDIPLHRAYFHEIAHPTKIVSLLTKLMEWCETEEFAELHPIHRASRLQHGFMQIYPYTEGSGKIARLLSNAILVHEQYQPCIVHTIDRQRYYESLKQPEPQLRDLMMESMLNGIANGEKFMAQAIATRRRLAR